MADSRLRLTRRGLLGGGLAVLASAGRARAFGDDGAFHPRALQVGRATWGGPRSTALARWSWELVRRTSAPARLVPKQIAADDPRLSSEPFAVWAGVDEIAPLSGPEIRGLSQFLDLGGVLLVDDGAPENGAFGRAARREIARVLPESPLVRLEPRIADRPEHVIYKSFYLLDGPFGRLEGPRFAEAVVRGRDVQVIFLAHDLLGALARTGEGTWAFPVEGGGPEQREQAVRFSVNLAMYVLCSSYKDDQVHAQALMRRRGRLQ